jgi:P22 coat protein - gene protein 5
VPATNTLLTINMITAKALAILHQKCNFIGAINRQYDDSFANSGAKIGSTLRIRLPVQYTVSTTPALSLQNTVETYVSLPITNQYHVDFSFSSAELTLSIDEFSARYIEPAIAVLAAQIEATTIGMMWPNVWNQVGTAGAAQLFKTVLQSRKLLLDNLTPQSKQWLLRINTQDNVDLVDSLKGLFQQSTQIASQYTDGVMGIAAGYEWAESTHLTTQTRGAENGAYTTAIVANQNTGNTLTVAAGAGAGNAGDVFTIAGVYRCHPETKVSSGVLQQFVLTAAYGGGAGNMSIAPGINGVSGSPQQNVITTANASAGLTFANTASTATGLSLAFHPDAFTFATADLVMPGGVDMASRVVKDGISMRAVRQYSISDDTFPIRIDVLWGAVAMRPQLACRLVAN